MEQIESGLETEDAGLLVLSADGVKNIYFTKENSPFFFLITSLTLALMGLQEKFI